MPDTKFLVYFDKDDPVTMFKVPKSAFQVPINSIPSSLDAKMYGIDHGLKVSNFANNVFIEETSNNQSIFTGRNENFYLEEEKNQNIQSFEYGNEHIIFNDNESEKEIVLINSSITLNSARLSTRNQLS